MSGIMSGIIVAAKNVYGVYHSKNVKKKKNNSNSNKNPLNN